MISAKPLCIIFDRRNRFIRVYNKIKYLMLSSLEKYNAKFDKVMYIISLKSNITYVLSHNFADFQFLTMLL